MDGYEAREEGEHRVRAPQPTSGSHPNPVRVNFVFASPISRSPYRTRLLHHKDGLDQGGCRGEAGLGIAALKVNHAGERQETGFDGGGDGKWDKDHDLAGVN